VDFDVLVQVLRAFEREGVRYAVFGAVALNLHGLVRATEDLDLFVSADAVNVDRLRRALRSVINDPAIDDIHADDLAGAYPAIQYVPPDGAFQIDLVARLGEMYTFEDLETMRVPVEDFEVTAVTPKMLYLMKRDTVRPKDRIDAEELRRRFGWPDGD
jgi:hypothetical protein